MDSRVLFLIQSVERLDFWYNGFGWLVWTSRLCEKPVNQSTCQHGFDPSTFEKVNHFDKDWPLQVGYLLKLKWRLRITLKRRKLYGNLIVVRKFCRPICSIQSPDSKRYPWILCESLRHPSIEINLENKENILSEQNKLITFPLYVCKISSIFNKEAVTAL